jgi:hypothetical protein
MVLAQPPGVALEVSERLRVGVLVVAADSIGMSRHKGSVQD